MIGKYDKCSVWVRRNNWLRDNNLTLGEIPFNELRVADIDSKVTLDGLGHKSYKYIWSHGQNRIMMVLQ